MITIAGQHGLVDTNGQTEACAAEWRLATGAFTPATHLNGCPHDCIDSGADNWSWPLKVYTLSRFSLVRDGRKVEFTGKVQQKPRGWASFAQEHRARKRADADAQ